MEVERSNLKRLRSSHSSSEIEASRIKSSATSLPRTKWKTRRQTASLKLAMVTRRLQCCLHHGLVDEASQASSRHEKERGAVSSKIPQLAKRRRRSQSRG
jgi:hypothetical protein